MQQKIHTFFNTCLRRIFNIRWPEKMRNEELWERAGQEPVAKQILRRKWVWIGHTLRKPASSTTRQALTWNPQGKRKRGRPRNSLLEAGQRLRQSLSKQGRTSWVGVARTAQNRVRWRTVVDGLCSTGTHGPKLLHPVLVTAAWCIPSTRRFLSQQNFQGLNQDLPHLDKKEAILNMKEALLDNMVLTPRLAVIPDTLVGILRSLLDILGKEVTVLDHKVVTLSRMPVVVYCMVRALYNPFSTLKKAGTIQDNISVTLNNRLLYLDSMVATLFSKLDTHNNLFGTMDSTPNTLENRQATLDYMKGILDNMKGILDNLKGILDKPKATLNNQRGVVLLAASATLYNGRTTYPDKLLFHNVSDTTTKEHLNTFVELVSGLEPVEILYSDEPGVVLITFKDEPAVDRVLTKTHTIDGRQLCIKRYMECLGLSGGVADPSVFPIPKPLILREVDSFKIMFIRQSIAASNAFKQQLFKTHAQFSFVGDTIQLECTLTSDVPNCRVLAKSWSADVQRVVMKYMGQIEAHQVEVMQQIWPTVESCITNNNGFQLDDAVTIPVPNKAIFVVIGMPHAAKDLKRKVREEVKVVEDEVERKKLEIRDTVTRLKPYQLRLLEAMSFPEQASSQHDGLSIEIDPQAITFQGQLGDVRDVQVLMYERLNCVQEEKITGMSNSKTALLGSLQTSRHMMQGQIKITLIDGEIAKETTLEQTVTKCLTEASNSGHTSIAFPALGTGNMNYPRDVVARTMMDAVSQFQQATPTTSLREVRIVVYYKDTKTSQTLEQTVTKCLTEASNSGHTSIAFPALGTGNMNYPRDVVARTMMDAVNHFQQATPTTSLREVRIVVYHKDTKTSQEFRHVQAQYSTVTAADNLPGPSVGPVSFGSVTINIIDGEIAKEKTHVIVNTTSSDLQLANGAVSASLLAAAGSSLQDECRTQYPNGITTGDVAKTKGHNLACREVYHLTLCSWSPGVEKTLEQTVTKCLTEASNSGHTSIAFPALGTGNMNYPRDAVAHTMIDAVSQFQQANPTTSLREVRIVVYHKDTQTSQVFRKELQKYLSSPASAAAPAAAAPAATTQAMPTGNRQRRRFQESGITAGGQQFSPPVQSPSPAVAQIPAETTLYIYAASEDNAQAVLNALDEAVMEKYIQKVVKDDILKAIGQDGTQRIKQTAEQRDVEVKVDQSTGCVVLDGLYSKVYEAQHDILDILRAAEIQRHKEATASMIASMVQWSFLEVTATGTQPFEYARRENHMIEAAYQKKEKTAEITDADGNVYIIDFNTMQEHPKNNPTDAVAVIRRDKTKANTDSSDTAFKLPKTWTSQNSSDTVSVVRLQPNSSEYKEVEKNFKKTVSNTVTAVDRIQNPLLYQQYAAKKSHLEKQNTGIQNEKTLWHGTAPDAIDNINRYGFNRSYCGKNGELNV
nr:hypothetical protein BaRGS_013518 [Batillaria attramentaria]